MKSLIKKPLKCYDKELTPINFAGEAFCFTGEFALGSREAVIEEALKRGGSFTRCPVQSGCIVVVGCVASDEWACGNYGRKIETAMRYRDKGCAVQIVPEEHFVNEILRFDAEGHAPTITPLKIKKADVNMLAGLAKGMVADGKVQQEEAEFLLQWLQMNSDLHSIFPVNILLPRIEEYLVDGILDETEAHELFVALEALSRNVG
ncbi:hypothetical protein [Desulfovibrio desulfuricans]|uniref:hypothetical protein n=1 Tax=Desulfovibrio desulfuricans TaxID=876 RepID=UPI0039841A44